MEHETQRTWLTPGRIQALRIVGMLAFVYLLVVTAWQSDDAFILFRTVDNFWNGDGLTWNPGHRVQSYSSMLWMLFCLVCHGIFGELYFSTLVLSILLASLATGLIVFRLSRWPLFSLAILMALSASASVVDYATSGLENALLSLLMVSLVMELGAREATGRLLGLSLLAALAILTRQDAALLVGPVLAWAIWCEGIRANTLKQVLLGLSPLIVWEIFSLIYYGSFVPNTAYAKLNLDLSWFALAWQGMHYFLDSLTYDPVTLLIVIAGAITAVTVGSGGHRALALGILLYLFYLLRIGGDFMSGRFFAVPAMTSAALLAVCWTSSRCDAVAPRLARGLPALLLAIAVYGGLWPESRWRSGSGFGEGLDYSQIIRPSGIADERAYYYPATGLLSVLLNWSELRDANRPIPPYVGAIEGRKFAASNVRVTPAMEVGFFGYFAGRDKIIIDSWALSDPLLARLPFRNPGQWRVGHYPRRIPRGYAQTLASGENRFADPEIATFYSALRSVTGGPIFGAERWKEIWRLNTGYYSAISSREDYR